VNRRKFLWALGSAAVGLPEAAKTLGLTVPATLLVAADQVLE
jgi:hypothetical protein